jgi:hypothetical protein
MAVITQTIQPGEQSNLVTEIQKALISLGDKIASSELFTATTAGIYGPTTQAAITALTRRFGFRLAIPPHFHALVGRLLNIAVGAELGNSAALRTAVRESFAAIQTAPVADPKELAWLARYATLARDFTTARKIIDLIPDGVEGLEVREEKKKIAAMVKQDTQQPSAPELLKPENYYTVVWKYALTSEVEELFSERPES